MVMKSICVYCGSGPGRTEIYALSARALAKTLVDRNIRLIYGGAGVGTMGVIADAVLELGGQAIGVIPEFLKQMGVAHLNLTEIHVTQSMHERKMLMAELSDGFIAMPGGIGTIEEIFEIWTWAQLGFHSKPCGLLNPAGYFDALSTFLDHSVEERFIKAPHRTMLIVEENPEALLAQFENYSPPMVEKVVPLRAANNIR